MNAQELMLAIRANDLERVGEFLSQDPGLAGAREGGLTPLHAAVMARLPGMASLLMECGANPYEGIGPHSEATSPLGMAEDRGYDEIAAILRRVAGPDGPAEVRAAMRAGDEDRALAILDARPELARFRAPGEGWTLLHMAARFSAEQAAGWLIDHGVDVNVKADDGTTPLDIAGGAEMRDFLRGRGAGTTPRAAVILGDVEFLRSRLESGELQVARDDRGWLLQLAVKHDRPEILEMLLDGGLDPDARVRVGEECDSWGMPLYECTRNGKAAMARLLLERGADANGQVYASGTPLSEAYGQRDDAMIALLEEFGGRSNASMAGLYRRKDLALRLLAVHGDERLADDGFSSGTVAEQLVGAAAKGGDPEILQLGMDRVDWPDGDRRWYGALHATLGFWNHWVGPWCHLEWDRGTYLGCFRRVLARVGRPNARLPFGGTLLHEIAAMGDHVTPDERVSFATAALEAGAELDVREELLESTPLGWACRWGRPELVALFLKWGADAREASAKPWAAPLEWARRKGHTEAANILRGR